MHLGGRGPGRARFLALHAGHPVFRGVGAELADADGQHFHHFFTLGVVVEAHLGHVQHDPFTGCIRQDQLLGDHQLLAGLYQQGIRIGVGFSHVGEPQLEFRRNGLQRLAVLFGRDHVFQIFPYQTAVGRRQSIFNSENRRSGQQQAVAECCHTIAKELHNFPMMMT